MQKSNKIEQDQALREWHESAPHWRKHAATIRTVFMPVTRALIEEAQILPGDKVLDIAGGPGEPSLTIAEVVGSSGWVTFTDAIAGMVEIAQDEAARRGLTNIEFQQCEAARLPFDDAQFDAVVSRLGAMFFSDIHGALREMLRVSRPGGRVSLVVWGNRERNPFSSVTGAIVSRYVDASVGACCHDTFRFADYGALAGILAEVGATDVRERVFSFHIAAPISFEEFWTMRSEMSGTLRDKLSTLSVDEKATVTEEVKAATVEFFPQGLMNFPAEMIIVTGAKSGADGVD